MTTNATDISNSAEGVDVRGSGVTAFHPAVTGPPAGRTFAVRYDKALAYPTPAMVDGRPT